MNAYMRCSRRRTSIRGGTTIRCTALLCASCLLLGCSQFPFSSSEKLADVSSVSVVRGPFDFIVLEQGELESSNNIEIICEVKSENGFGTPILWVVEEGSYVYPGDRLVELDSSGLEESLKQQRISVANAEATLIRSRANVRTAEISLQQYMEGTYVSERKTRLSQVALAEQQLRTAELQLETAKGLVKKGLITQLQIESDEFAVQNARDSLELAKTEVTTLDELIKEKNRIQLQSDIEAAKATLESDQVILAERKNELDEIADQIDKCNLFSPAEGVVVHNNFSRGRRGSETVIEEGAMIRERQVIIKLPDLTNMRVKARINESRITQIQSGQPAMVRIDGIDGEMQARVERVNRYAEPGNWYDSAVKEYAVFIEIMEPPESIRTGMTAEVRILVDQLDDALQLPVESVYEHKGHLFCLRQQGSSWETVEIGIGGSNTTRVAITAGLSEGDVVVDNPRSRLDLLQLPDLEDVSDRNRLLEIRDGLLENDAGETPAASVQ